jgi:hypothetical protein
LLAAAPAEADFHLVQFIEIGMSFFSGQNCQGTGSHIDFLSSPCVPLGSGATLLFFDAAGN